MANLPGDENNNVINGLDNEDDSIYGYGGNDTLSGLGGNDYLDGGDGNDTLNGGAGNDALLPGNGVNVVDGGDGTDYLYLYLTDWSNSDPVTITYTTPTNGTVTGGIASGTTFRNVESLQIVTGSGNDVINVTASTEGGNYWSSWANYIFTNDGDDTVTTGIGRDWVDGGFGNDTINTGDGDDYAYGSWGNDTINAGAGNDTIDGNLGSDVIIAGDGDDYISGAGYSDTTSTDTDTVNAGGGNDTIQVGYGQKGSFDGGTGSDVLEINNYYWQDVPLKVTFTSATKPGTFSGGTFTNVEQLRVYGGNGDDTIDIRALDSSTALSANQISSGGGNDRVTGSNFADSISGGTGNDSLSAGGGDDYIYGESGNDTLGGGANNDTIWGGSESDRLTGGLGNDSLYGESEADTLTGVDTATSIARPGLNEIDLLVGGSGRDTFVLGDRTRVYYNDGNGTTDGTADFAVIQDYSVAQRDIIRLRGIRADYEIQENVSFIDSTGGWRSGTGIYLKSTTGGPNELVALVQGSTSTTQVNAGLSFIAPV